MYCDYKYDYNDSSCVVTNMGSMLKIKYDLKSDGTVPQAFLNKKKYNVSEIQIYQPSRNIYKNIRADIEFVIIHEGSNNAELVVSIPFRVSSTAPKSSSASTSSVAPTSAPASSSAAPTSSPGSAVKAGSIVLDNIINDFKTQTAGSLPNPNQSYQLTINNFNLNNFIPNTPYYFYNIDTTTCKQANIAFDLLKSGQLISRTAIDKLNSMLTTVTQTRVGSYPAITEQTIYVNSNGPNYQGTATDDKIYIDCQPTGQEGKELYKKTIDIGSESRQQGLELINKFMNSGSVQFILAIALGLIVLGLGKRAFTRS
jgi:carbonic anhydrase